MPSFNDLMRGTRGKPSSKPREHDTSPPQHAIAESEEGQKVHLNLGSSVREGRSHPCFNSLTGEVIGEQDRTSKVQVNDGGKEKTVIVRPAYLRAQQ